MSGREVGKFMQAVRDGDIDTVRAMAADDVSLVHATDPKNFGATALIHATGAGDRAMVEVLLGLGADIHQRSDWWAGSFGVLDGCSDEMAEFLLARGARLTPHAAARLGKLDALRRMLATDALVAHARGGDGQTPLHFARTTEIVDVLLAHAAGIDTPDIDHASTPAQWLATSRPEVAAHLVSRGAKADPFVAVCIGDVGVLESVLAAEPDGVHVRVTRERFVAAAPAAGHIYLYTIGEGATLVHAAAARGRGEVIRWLAAHGADVNARGGYDDGTPLHAAAWSDRAEAIDALIYSGANIEAVSGKMHRNEPIGWAIVGGSVGAARALIERGAKVRPVHIEDAKKGAGGAFRCFNPSRPIERWREIMGIVEGRAR